MRYASFGWIGVGDASAARQPASVAFSKLGYPTNEATVAGRKFYVWSRETNAMDAYSCKIRVFVDKDEIITDGDYDGNLGGCANYIDRLQ